MFKTKPATADHTVTDDASAQQVRTRITGIRQVMATIAADRARPTDAIGEVLAKVEPGAGDCPPASGRGAGAPDE